jgi:hypothetical protein
MQSTGVIGNLSCKGISSCEGNDADISHRTCQGNHACMNNEKDIGENSCQGPMSCFHNKGPIHDSSVSEIAYEGTLFYMHYLTNSILCP